MSEFKMIDDSRNNRGFSISQSYSPIWLDLYRLSSIFAASKLIAQFKNNEKYEPLDSLLRNEFECSEISRILINLAVVGRNNLDNGYHTFDSSLENENYVGVIEDLISNEIKDLNFREACNKIIHCEFINWDIENAENFHKNDGLNPILYIYGTYNKKQWKIKLNIYDFIVTYLTLIQV